MRKNIKRVIITDGFYRQAKTAKPFKVDIYKLKGKFCCLYPSWVNESPLTWIKINKKMVKELNRL